MGLARAHLLATLAAFALILAVPPVTADMNDTLNLLWGRPEVQYDSNGHQIIALLLDRWTSSAFSSKNQYMFGKFEIEIKLVANNSAGTVTTLYMMSEGLWDFHGEIDIEFLGNITGEPYTMHTNIYANGNGGREVQYRLWFDPTKDFHKYSIIWSPLEILILVDDMAIRQFKNHMTDGVPYPNYQPMRVYSTIWNADDWATMGGRAKTDWSQAPFLAYFRNFIADACIPYQNSWMCNQGTPSGQSWFDQGLEIMRQQQLKEADKKYKIYDYCKDSNRFPNGYPKECGLS